MCGPNPAHSLCMAYKLKIAFTFFFLRVVKKREREREEECVTETQNSLQSLKYLHSGSLRESFAYPNSEVQGRVLLL